MLIKDVSFDIFIYLDIMIVIYVCNIYKYLCKYCFFFFFSLYVFDS